MPESFLSTVVEALRSQGHTVAGVGRVVVPGVDARTVTLQVDGEHMTLQEAATMAGLAFPADTTRTGSHRRPGSQ
jgi:hypothetical protein